jgi:MoaA/NifB/PqqE/SkfB family radical SAM enzyme
MIIRKNPTVLEIHPGIHCCLNCDFCFRDGSCYLLDREPIDGNILKRLIFDFARLGGKELLISGGLEPFSQDVTVCHALLLADRAGLKSRIYTNGTEASMHLRRSQELLLFKTEQIRFSFHAISERIFSKITGISDAKSIMAQIQGTISSLLENRIGNSPRIGIGYLVTQANVSDVCKAASFWKRFGVDFMNIRFDVLAMNGRSVSFNKQLQAFLDRVESDAFSPLQIEVGDFVQGQPSLPESCFSPFHKIVVDPFGFVWSCCLQAQPGRRPSWARLGDLTVQTYQEIVEAICKKFPRRHCKVCTPYELRYNKMHA